MSRPSNTSPTNKPLPGVVDKENELGTLIVVLLKARNLNDKHSFRKQDVFAQATLNGATKQTQVDFKGGQHPEWDGEVRFTIMKNTGAKFRKLEVACYAKEPRSDDILGKGTVDITETLKTGEFDDWVPLDIDGVQRGDIYLEMTYYANAPPPVSAAPAVNKFLAPVKNQDGQLMRRPSKLKPADRLSRPVQPQSQYQYPNTGTSPPSNYGPPRPSGLQNGYTPPRRDGSYDQTPPAHSRNSSGGVPNFLQPGGAPHRPGTTPLPNLLRPGATPSPGSPAPGSAPNPYLTGHSRTTSMSPPPVNTAVPADNPYLQSPGVAGPGRYGPSPAPISGTSVTAVPLNPYLASSTPAPGPAPVYETAQPPPQQPGYGPSSPAYGTHSGAPLLWQQTNAPPPSNSGFSFPTPNIISPTRESFQPVYQNVGGAVSDPGYANYAQGYHGQGLTAPPYRHASSVNSLPLQQQDDRVDAHLLARYQSPLPLPPGAANQPSRPAPSPPTTVTSSGGYRPAQMSPVAASPPKALTPAPVRLDALRRAEEDAARRREQELKDLELALQLDRELNMQEASSGARTDSSVSVPGAWPR